MSDVGRLTDAALTKALAANPRMMTEALRSAERVHGQVRSGLYLMRLSDILWAEAGAEISRARDVERYRLIREAEAVQRALGDLSQNARGPLCAPGVDHSSRLLVMAAHPALQAWQTRMDERAAAVDAANARQVEQRRIADEAARPAGLVAELEAVGVTLSVQRDAIAATNPALIIPALLEELQERKAEVLALLQDRVAAAAPVVVA